MDSLKIPHQEPFTVEEIALMQIYETPHKQQLLKMLTNSLPYVKEPDAKELMSQTIGKLETCSQADLEQALV